MTGLGYALVGAFLVADVVFLFWVTYPRGGARKKKRGG